MSLKSKIEAVIYASEEPVTLPQLAGLLGEEADAELEAIAALQAPLPLDGETEPTFSVTSGVDAETSEEPPPSELATEDGDPPAGADRDDGEVAVAATASPESAGTEPTVDATADPRAARERERRVREHLRRQIDSLMREYAGNDRGIEIREVAGGFRMGTKPEYHDAVRGFARSLKPALKLTLQALETLAVVAYKQPVTAAEISEIRGVDSSGVLGGLMTRKLIATAGRKQVIGRPMLYKTTKEFLVRFGLKDVHELPSMEEFERLAGELNEQEDLPMEATDTIIERANARGDADHIREVTGDAPDSTDTPEMAISEPLAGDAAQATSSRESAGTTDTENDLDDRSLPESEATQGDVATGPQAADDASDEA